MIISISNGSEWLLISDGRTGRWVLLGAEHVAELERRLVAPEKPDEQAVRREPPTIPLKGLAVHLQSALELAETLDDFVATGEVTRFEEITQGYSLTVSRSTDGIELRDSDKRIALTSREAGKWAGIIRAELDRLSVRRVERGRIRTVFADVEVQWTKYLFLAVRCGLLTQV